MTESKITKIQLNQTKIWMGIFILLIVSFVVMQLYTLSSIGTQGEKVSFLRSRQANVKVENEILRAKIRELQSTDNIIDTATDRLQMNSADVTYLAKDNLLAAQK